MSKFLVKRFYDSFYDEDYITIITDFGRFNLMVNDPEIYDKDQVLDFSIIGEEGEKNFQLIQLKVLKNFVNLLI